MAKKITDLSKEEAIELLSYTGIEDAEKFKDEFNSKFLPVETAHTNDEVKKKVVGTRMRELTSKFLPIAKLIDPSASLNKLSDKYLEEVFDEFAPAFTNKLSELEQAAKSGNDKKVNDLMKQLEDKEKSYLAEKEVNQRLAGEYDQFKAESTNKLKSYKVNHQLGEIKQKIGFIDDITDIQRAGFDTLVNSNYQFDIDENEQLRILDKEGKPVQSKVKAAIATPEEVLIEIAEQNNLRKKNNAQSGNKFVSLQGRKAESNAGDKKLPLAYQQRLKKLGLNG